MGSSHCGEVGLGKGRSSCTSLSLSLSSSSSSSSSRKGKNSKTSSEKPKQPRRGLGVAQLEKIRLHNQFMANHLHNSLHSSFHHNKKEMGFGESEPNDRYCQSESRHTANQNSARMPVTLPLLDQTMEWTKRRHDQSHSTGSVNQNSDILSGSQELDLELRLSL